MSIITLTTDFGRKDSYLASLKASILSEINDVNIIDISHDIEPFNILEAAIILKSCYKDFPKGTIHLIAVDDEISIESEHLAVYANGYYFIGSDNGLFSILLDDFKPEKIFRLNISQKSDFLTFAAKDIFSVAACHISRGGTLELIGNETNDFVVKKNILRAVVENNMIRGIVTYIDNYGNAITNISKAIFYNTIQDKKFSILFGREDDGINAISSKYKDVEIAEKLALFNSENFLQISLNQGKASSLLGMKFFDKIRIVY
jgi:S-adenosylmethionine hydrolase|tara:strand:+ start:2933 stop:3715 length:783 start_codon:yes stop_codon:yes gene_type:complete